MDKIINKGSSSALQQSDSLIIEKTKESPFQAIKDKINEEYEDIKRYMRTMSQNLTVLEAYSVERFGHLVTFDGIAGYIEKERYWVNEPYAFVSILFNNDKNEYLYTVVEPELSVYERMILETIYENILDTFALYETQNSSKNEILEKKVLELLDSYSIEVTIPTIYKILYYINRDYIGYERLDVLMRDQNIEDISCDGSEIPIFLYDRKYQNIKTNRSFEGPRLDSFVMKLVQRCGKHVSIGEPLINCMLPDGSRLNASLGKEITFRGSSFTIRKFREQAFTPVDLINNGTYSSDILAYLWLAVENSKNILIAGSTASGKTSTLNSISLFIPPLAKIVSIEDTQELVLHHPNWIGSVTRESYTKNASVNEISMYELLRQALRQRPEYILVGEIRGKEAMTLFQAMSTGHTTYSTMHADSVDTVISRLEGDPLNIPRVMIQALDILCIQSMMIIGGKRVRRMDALIEFTGIDPQSQDLRFNLIYKWDPKNDVFNSSGKSVIIQKIKERRDWDENKMKSELEGRKKILEHMAKKGLDEFDAIALIEGYYLNPEKTLSNIKL